MYIPPRYKAKDLKTALQIINENPFALLISNNGGTIAATHIPILLEETDNQKLKLIGHLALFNPQSQSFIENNNTSVLSIFQGPHCYISPSLYDSKRNVPTWNYVAAHVNGILKVVMDPKEQISILEKTLKTFEPSYVEQWSKLPEEYIEALRKEILAFEIEIESIEGKTKLSQNKKIAEQKRIAEHLLNSKDTIDQGVARWMIQEMTKDI